MSIGSRTRSWDGLIIALIFLAAAFTRLHQLDADPPSTVGLHFISDEGWWVHNARNRVLFDEWIMDEFNQSLLASPTFCMGTYGVYSIFGVSYYTSRLLPVLSGLLTLLLFAGLLYNHSPPGVATLGALLFGCNFAFTSLNRTAYVDSTALLFLVLSWWLLETFLERVWAVYLAGMAFALAIVTKSYLLSIAPPVALILLYRLFRKGSQTQWKQVLLNFVLFLCGVGSVYLLWRKYIYLPYFDQYQIMYHLWQDGNFPATIQEFFRNLPGLFVRRHGASVVPARFFLLNTTLLILTAYRIIQYLSSGFGSIREIWQRIPYREREALIVLGLLLCEIAPLTAKPFRRYILLYLPMIFLASRTIVPIDKPASPSRRSWLIQSLIPGVTACITAILLAPFLGDWIPLTSSTLSWISGVIIISVLSIGVLVALRYYSRSLPALPTSMVLLVFLLCDGGFHLHSMATRSFSLRDTSRQLATQYFRPETVVLGGIANSLCMEGQAQALAIWGRQEAPRVLNQDPVRRFHPDYLLILKEIDGQAWGFEERYHKYVHAENFLETLHLLPKGDSYRVLADLYIAPKSENPDPETPMLLVQNSR